MKGHGVASPLQRHAAGRNIRIAAFNTQADKGCFSRRAIGGFAKDPEVSRETLKAQLAKKHGREWAEKIFGGPDAA